MLLRPRGLLIVVFFLVPFTFGVIHAQHPANANPAYQKLRALLPGGEVIGVKDLELKRDAATFTFSLSLIHI